MASIQAIAQAKVVRRSNVLARIATHLEVQRADLHVDAEDDSELAMIITLERIADALDVKGDAKTPAKAQSLAGVEQQLEAETGHDVVQTGDNPPTFVETDEVIDVNLDEIDPHVDFVEFPDGSTLTRNKTDDPAPGEPKRQINR